jgi:hypothetical protein
MAGRKRPAENGRQKTECREAKRTPATFVIPTPNAAEESATPQNLFGEMVLEGFTRGLTLRPET